MGPSSLARPRASSSASSSSSSLSLTLPFADLFFTYSPFLSSSVVPGLTFVQFLLLPFFLISLYLSFLGTLVVHSP